MNNKLFEILNKQQGKIIQSKDRKIVVSAGPGSGKTYTIVKKIEQEFLCEEKNKNIIVTSFTKEASKQLKEKITACVDVNDSYIGTLDSFVLKEIIEPYKNRYLRCRGYDSVDRLKYRMPSRNSDVEIITRQGIRKYNIESIKYELNRWIIDLSKGVYEISSLTYLIAIDLLKKIPSAQKYIQAKYSAIYIDEAQDLNEFQHRFIKYIVNKCSLNSILIGDKNQSIYKFRGSRPELFYKLKETDGYTEYKITISVRCHPSILFFSNLIIGDKKNEKYKGENHVYLDVAPIFENLSNVDNDFMVLFENNSDAIECYKYCKKNSIDAIYTKSLSLTNKKFENDYLELIEEILRFRCNIFNKNPKLVYSIDSFQNFLSDSYIMINSKVIHKITNYKKTEFEYVISILKMLKVNIDIEVYDELMIQLNDPMIRNHYINYTNVNRIMTIHSSKGLEAENVFVRIARIPYIYDDEYKRKLFVAFSRAKNNLYISYKEDDINGSQLDLDLRKNYSIVNGLK